MSIRTRNQNRYKKKEWNILCERCRFKFKSCDLKEEWTGLLVCKNCFEGKHPGYTPISPSTPSIPEYYIKESTITNPNIRVVSYNIKGADNTTGGSALSELVSNISSLNADIVLFQELDDETQLSNLLVLMTDFAGYVYKDNGTAYNNGIVYKGTLLDSNSGSYTADSGRGWAAAKVQFSSGTSGWFISTHLNTGDHNNPATGSNELKRVAEVEELKVITDGLDGFVVWGGDCNFYSTTGEEGYELALSYWTNCLMEAPPNFVPSNNVGRDWIFIKSTSTGIQMKTTQSSIVDDLIASDHQPVWADILIPHTYG